MMGGENAHDCVARVVWKRDVFRSTGCPLHRIVRCSLTAHRLGWLDGLDLESQVANGSAVVPRSRTDVCDGCRRRYAEHVGKFARDAAIGAPMFCVVLTDLIVDWLH